MDMDEVVEDVLDEVRTVVVDDGADVVDVDTVVRSVDLTVPELWAHATAPRARSRSAIVSSTRRPTARSTPHIGLSSAYFPRSIHPYLETLNGQQRWCNRFLQRDMLILPNTVRSTQASGRVETCHRRDRQRRQGPLEPCAATHDE